MTPDLSAFPGGDLVMAGLRDLALGVTDSIAALLVQIGAPRLAAAGLVIPPYAPAQIDAELRLYARLQANANAHGAYNALLRCLISCEAALEGPAGLRLGLRGQAI